MTGVTIHPFTPTELPPTPYVLWPYIILLCVATYLGVSIVIRTITSFASSLNPDLPIVFVILLLPILFLFHILNRNIYVQVVHYDTIDLESA